MFIIMKECVINVMWHRGSYVMLLLCRQCWFYAFIFCEIVLEKRQLPQKKQHGTNTNITKLQNLKKIYFVCFAVQFYSFHGICQKNTEYCQPYCN